MRAVDVAAWLNTLGLERYERTFRDNGVDADVLPQLTADDLTDLGVTLIGHRRKLLAAIAAMRADTIWGSANEGPGDALGSLAGASPHASPGAERRQLTVMFCDLVGSTALSGRFDPEDLREVIAAYQGAVKAVVVGADGFIARFMGDGVLAFFGYPQAHENDAERAVRAGLAAVEAVGRIDVKSIRLQARVGISTGLVVVGDLIGEGWAQEWNVVGETPNLAARLQSVAEPNAVVIAEGTHRLLGGLFEYRELGAIQLKGITRPVSAWQVLRPSIVASRFEALRGGNLTRLVGRDEELELLVRRWARVKAGDGQVVLLSGEAGIGKSRIAETLSERIDADPFTRLRYSCSSYHQNSALFPFLEDLRRAAGFAHEDAAPVKWEKLEALAARAAPSEDDIALLADLLSLPASLRHPLPDLSPQRKKERTLEALLSQLGGLARQQPVLMVVEDAHWLDPTSRDLLDLTVERVRSLPVLLVITLRPEFQPSWIGQPRVTVLALNRLDRRDSATLVLQVAGGRALPDEVVEQIVARTDGVPLFVEELTKSVLESGLLREEGNRYVLDRALPPLAIPTSLHDSLMARLDRLGPVRHIAQIGAAIAREFSYALLQAVSGLSQDELQAALARLVASELISQRGTPPDAVYAFKHTLVQDAAHSSLLRGDRQRLHAQIAAALETCSPELIDSQPELLALHYAEAGQVEKSVQYWGLAGRRSAASSAMAEAAAQLQKGLEQLVLLPETPQRQRRELEFWSALGAALRFVKGQATPEMGRAYARARELWEQLGSPPQFLHIPYGESFYRVYRGEFDLAQRLDEDLLRVSRQRDDKAGLVLGHTSAGRTLMYAGRFAAARLHLEEVLALYDPISHRLLGQQSGSDPRIGARGLLGIVLFCLGYPDQGVAQSNAAIAEASTLAHAPSLVASLAVGCRLLSLRGDSEVLGEWAERLMAVAGEQGFPSYQALGTIFRGWSRVMTGDVSEGVSLLRSGAGAYGATGAEARISFHLALLAKACEIAEQVEEAASLLEDSLQIAERIGERWFAAELYRHKGQLRLRQGEPQTAAELYRQALEIAKEQEAKLWELRAAASLARLLGDQGCRAQARDLLAPVYGCFTEGFDTPDLKGAKTLLAELS